MGIPCSSLSISTLPKGTDSITEEALLSVANEELAGVLCYRFERDFLAPSRSLSRGKELTVMSFLKLLEKLGLLACIETKLRISYKFRSLSLIELVKL